MAVGSRIKQYKKFICVGFKKPLKGAADEPLIDRCQVPQPGTPEGQKSIKSMFALSDNAETD